MRDAYRAYERFTVYSINYMPVSVVFRIDFHYQFTHVIQGIFTGTTVITAGMPVKYSWRIMVKYTDTKYVTRVSICVIMIHWYLVSDTPSNFFILVTLALSSTLSIPCSYCFPLQFKYPDDKSHRLISYFISDIKIGLYKKHIVIHRVKLKWSNYSN